METHWKIEQLRRIQRQLRVAEQYVAALCNRTGSAEFEKLADTIVEANDIVDQLIPPFEITR